MLRIALLLIPFYAARRSLLRVADGLRAVDFFKAVAVIFGVGLLSAAWAESPDIAGRVQFVVGEVSAADRDGATRALGKRDAIFEGDTVTTGPSASAQIMMIDGARIAVRPNSAFMVNEYRAPSADDVGASILTLLKGGFRTLSGLIGEESAQYRVDTPCCSIGLRGTDHAVFHIPAGEEDTYGGGEAGTYNRVYKGATFLESAGVTLDITPQTDAGFAARGQPPVFVPDIPETAEGAVVLAPSEDENEESDESEAAENESKESESEDESESETETAETDDSNSESNDAESESETADTDDSNSETETAETADADDSNSGSDDAVLAESPGESSSALETAETVEIAIESVAPPVADLQNPADIADALQRENTMPEPDPVGPITMPEPEPSSPVISLTSDLTMLQEGRQVILRVSSDIAVPSGGLLVTINIGTAMAGEFGISGGVCSALECVVVIPAGMTEAELILTPISDSVNEDLENWMATLVDGGLNYNIDNTMMDVGFDISDQPVIGIATADMAMVREGGEIRLTVSSDIAAPSGGLLVTINIGTAMAGEFGITGGVCSALECVVTIPAGMTEAELILTPISDTAMESAERWTATLVDGGLNYNIDNTMMDVGFDISDQPVIGIATADMAMVREGGEIRLTVSSDIAAPSGGLMVTINIGTAMAGEFGISGGVCSALECVVTIPAGMTEAELILTPISDTAMESAERWTATLVDGGLNYNIDDTMMAVGFDISDQPVIGIATADMAMVREGGEIRLTVSSDIAAPSGGLMVTINIGTAMAGEFGISGGVCSALECVVTIPAGMLAATLTITPISDTAMESAERWTATLVDGGLNYNIDDTMMAVGFDISDQPVIGIATADMAMVREGGEIRLTVSSDIAAPSGGLMVTINIGTAMAGEFGISGGDCTGLECVVVIPAGMLAATLTITPISDTAMESAERWTATLVDGGLNYNIDNTMMDVGFDISDQPVIGIATADMAMVREGGEIRLTVSSDIAAPSGGLLVTINIGTAMAGEFGISGGVCSALECVVVIPAGMLAATLTITPISDTAMESAERWTATLVDGGLNYNIDDTMMAVGFDISDQPVIGIATADMAMVREGGEIRLTVSSDIAAPSGGLLVTINIGTAMAGEFGIAGGDCSALECVVTIPAGMTEAELILTPISDTAMESAERWTATLVDGGLNYNIDDTMMDVGFDISDQPVIGIATADMAMVREGGEIRLTVSSDIAAPSGGLLVTINIGTAMAGEFGISGGDCSALECVVTIPAGMTEAELILTPISDTAMESAERWTATLVDGGLNYNIDDTMMAVGFDISDQPVIGIATADMAMVREGGEIRLTVSSDIAAPSGGLLVTINIGTAMAGEFGISGGVCSALECVVVIPAGMLAATLTITPISDTAMESAERWTATLVDGGLNYNIDNTMMDVGFDISDQPVIGIATADMAMVREGGEIRLTVSSDIAAPSGGLMVTINIGTAMAGEFGISGGDCTALECVVVIPAGMLAATLTITPISDTAMESAERWTATLVDGGLNYNIDNTMMDVGFDISDQPVIGIATADMAMVREGGEIRLTVSSDIAAPSGGLLVTINIGTAMAGEFGIAGGDCSALECVVTIPAGMTEAELILTPISDTAMESAERWTATLVDGGLNYNIDDTMMDVGFDISDQPVIGIATADMAMVREGGEIRLTVSSDIAAPSGGLLVTINIGTAMAGEFGISGGDCSALECVVTIPAGMTEAELILTPISDTAMESAERWTATLVDGGLNYNIDDTMMAVGFDISDQPVIGIATADMAMVREGGEIRLTVSSDIAAPSGGLLVTINIGTAMAGEFGISGGVCSALECVVVIPAGMLAATLTITPISDTAMESAERWTATLVDGGLNYNIDNTMMDVGFDISDQPVIGIATADMAMVREGGEIRLTVSSDIAAPSGGLMVTINIGTAMAGEFGISGGDCTGLECVVVIPAGMLAATLTITPISDTAMESAERWTATLVDGGLNYNIDNTMMDVGFDISDQPVIGIATADMAMVREGGEIRLTVSSDIAAPSGGLMVTINIGTAMAGEFGIAGGDCTGLECVVVIPAGMLAATLTITPISDSVNEDLENWMATLVDGGLNYNIDNTMMNVGFDISDDPLLLAVVDVVDGDILDDAPHVQGHDVLLAWHAVPGFDSASSYRVYRDGVRADGEFIDDRGTESLTINNGLWPLTVSENDVSDISDGSVNRIRCTPRSACRAAVAPGTSFIFSDFGLFDAESGRIIGLFDGGVSHTYEIRAVDENGVETLVVGPIALTAPAVVDNNLEDFVLPEINENIAEDNAVLGAVNEHLPVLDAVMPSDFVFGNGGILASQTDVDVISDDRVFSYLNLDVPDFRASTYEGTTPDLGYLLGLDDQPRVYVYRFGDLNPDLLSFGVGIDEFTFSYAIEAGDVTRLTDYDVLIRPTGEEWEFGLADGSRVDLTHAETFFEVVGTADLVVPGVPGNFDIDGIASFGSNNERVFSRFSVEGGGNLLSGRFDIIPQPDFVDPLLLAVVDVVDGDILDDAPHVQGHDVVLAWHAVPGLPGFDSASSYRVYRDGVRADGEFIDDRGTESLTIDNGIVPLSFSIDSCDANGCLLDIGVRCSPADACRAAVENVPGTSFIFSDFGLFDAESGRIIGLFDGGVSHTYEIRAVDENGVETLVVGPIAFTAPAVVDNNLEVFVLPEINANIVEDNAVLGAVNEYLPVLDAVMPSDFIIGNGGILALQTDVDVISGDRVFSNSNSNSNGRNFRASTYEGTTPDPGSLLGLDNPSRVYVHRALPAGSNLDTFLFSGHAGIEEFTFSYAIEAGDVTRLTDYDVLIRPRRQDQIAPSLAGERWEFGLADGSRVDLTHAETFFEVVGTANVNLNIPDEDVSGIASFGSNNERVFSRFSVEGGNHLLSGRFDIPAGGNSE